MTANAEKEVERPLVEHRPGPTKSEKSSENDVVVAKDVTASESPSIPNIRVFKDGTLRKALYEKPERQERLQQVEEDQENLQKADGLPKTSGTGTFGGKLIPEMDPVTTRLLRECSTFHARCIIAKANALVGFGHKKRKIHTRMNALMAPGKTWQQVSLELAEDYFEHGRAYLECVFDGDQLTRVNYRRVADVVPCVMSSEVDESGVAQEEKSWFVVSVDGTDGDIHLRPYEQPDLIIENADGTFVENIRILELRQPSTKNNWISYPQWEPVVQQLELSDTTNQFFYSWFYNRAVPALAVLLAGNNISQQSIDSLRQAFERVQNPEDAWKTVVAAVPGADTEMLVKSLSASEGQEQVLQTVKGVLAEEIVSGHGVPPLLAGIQIPGRMAATNELPNTITQFQILEISPHQVYFSERFGMTFGKDVDELSETDFCPEPVEMAVGMEMQEPGSPLPQLDCNGYVTLTDRMNVVLMQATARMKDPATSPGRDPSQGVAQNGRQGNQARGVNTSRGT